jgi:ParB-like nuclease domain
MVGRTCFELQYRPVGDLKNNPRNARVHSKHQIRQIASSIKAFGFTNPVLLDKDNTIVAGHGRVAAAKLLGISDVPTIRLENLSSDQLRAYVLADNRLAEKAGWDKSILAIELQHLISIESDFDVTVTGFEIPEIDLVLSTPSAKPDPDDVFELSETPEPISPTWRFLAVRQAPDSVRKFRSKGILFNAYGHATSGRCLYRPPVQRRH